MNKIPMPRAKIGDIIISNERQFLVTESLLNPEKTMWGYICLFNNYSDKLTCSLMDNDIIYNLSTNINYQEEDKDHNGIPDTNIKLVEDMQNMQQHASIDEIMGSIN